jgi:(p)ppGpp synthase/HD superfamily hydrolase
MVKDAKELALKMHEGMTDKYGNPYFEHLERVANRVREMEYDMVDETSEINLYIAAAYLHDVVEDTDCLIGDIIDKFGETIAEAVKLLTRGEEETYADYVIGIKKSVYLEGKIARVVKMADLLDHLMGPTPCPPNLVKRYEKSLYSLMGKL